jgi:hypothetical protein
VGELRSRYVTNWNAELLKDSQLMLLGFHEAYSATSKDWQELAEPGAGSRGASLP